MEENVPRPNFFIVGAPRCGTTSLFYYLRQHPQVFMPEPRHKEPHYFAPEMYGSHAIRDEAEYRALFADAGDAKRVGEASVFYLYSSEAADRIHAFDPHAKIIIMLRDPVELMQSLHRMYLGQGNEDIADFEAALAAEPDRRDGRRIPSGAYATFGLQYTQMARYASHVQRWLDVFGDHVLVLLLEDLKREPTATYRRVLEHLGVATDHQPDFAAYNVGQAQHIKGFFRRHPKLQRAVAAMTTPWMRHRAGALVARVAPSRKQPTIDPPLERRLRSDLHDDIDALGELIGRDLSAWKV